MLPRLAPVLIFIHFASCGVVHRDSVFDLERSSLSHGKPVGWHCGVNSITHFMAYYFTYFSEQQQINNCCLTHDNSVEGNRRKADEEFCGCLDEIGTSFVKFVDLYEDIGVGGGGGGGAAPAPAPAPAPAAAPAEAPKPAGGDDLYESVDPVGNPKSKKATANSSKKATNDDEQSEKSDKKGAKKDKKKNKKSKSKGKTEDDEEQSEKPPNDEPESEKDCPERRDDESEKEKQKEKDRLERIKRDKRSNKILGILLIIVFIIISCVLIAGGYIGISAVQAKK